MFWPLGGVEIAAQIAVSTSPWEGIMLRRIVLFVLVLIGIASFQAALAVAAMVWPWIVVPFGILGAAGIWVGLFSD